MTRVSVLLAVYNGAETVGLAIESIRAQTFADWELIVVDDGSTDGTPEVLSSFADPRIRVIRNERNRGLAASLNIAFGASSGELIARMDADDESLPPRLERQEAFLRAHPEVDILGTAAILAGEGRVIRPPLDHEMMAARIFRENPLIHPSVMMRRHVLEALGGYDESLRRAQDYDLWFRAIERFRCHNLEEPLIRYSLPKRATLRSSTAAARVAWMNGRRRHMPLRAALFAIRYVAGFAIARLRGHL